MCTGCNRQYRVRGSLLKRGGSTQCADCHNKDQALKGAKIDLTGKNIGQFTVIKYLGKSLWECRCSCGNISKVKTFNLTQALESNKDYKCASCSYKDKLDDITGKTYGYIKVLQYIGNGYYRCLCTGCNKEKIIQGKSLKSGATKSCGCMMGDNILATRLDKYGEVCTTKIGENRSKDQILLCNDKEILQDYLENMVIAPTVKELSKVLGISECMTLRKVHKFGLENLVEISPNVSKPEQDLCDYIRSLTNEEVIQSDRTELKDKELDIYIPSRKLAIEFNGTYWHSDIYKHKNYHQDKTVQCAKLGIRLIHIFEYEWIDTEKRVKLQQYLKDILLDKKEVIYGRLTTVSVISSDTANEFIGKYHLQGIAQASIRYGLYRETELIGVLTLGKPRFNSNYEYEVIRLCWKPGILVIGGLEKLFKTFIKDYNPSSIITYCDIGKFTGNSYTRINFKITQDSLTRPNYVWVKPDTNEVLQRYQTQKHKLTANGLCTENDTEDSIMEQLGFLKIYDAGNIRLVYNK